MSKGQLTGMPNGRPLLFKSAEELQIKIDKYFDSCYRTHIDDTGKEDIVNIRPLTITGLAVSLECDRETLLNYGKQEEFFGTVRAAKLRIQNFAEENLFTNRNASGIIFNLKNNYGWVDKIETDNTNNNLNQDLTNLTEDERAARIAELINNR